MKWSENELKFIGENSDLIEVAMDSEKNFDLLVKRMNQCDLTGTECNRIKLLIAYLAGDDFTVEERWDLVYLKSSRINDWPLFSYWKGDTPENSIICILGFPKEIANQIARRIVNNG